MAQLQRRYGEGSGDIVSKKNNTANTIVMGSVVQLDTNANCVVLPTGTTAGQFGITMHDIPAGYFGDIQIRGKAIALANGVIAVGGEVMPATTGKVTAFSAGGGTNAALLGKANTAAAADGDYIELELTAPGVIKQG